MEKILFITRQLGLGGTEKRLLQLKASLCNTFEIEVHSLIGHQKEYSLLHQVEKKPRHNRLFDLTKKIRQFNPKIIHAFDLESGIYAKAATKLFGIKIPIISGYGASIINNRLIKALLSLPVFTANLYICNSEAGRLVLQNYTKGKVITIHNGLNPLDFEAATRKVERPEWKINNRPVIGYIGKMDKIKHGERMIDIAIEMENHPANPVFIIIGSGPQEEEAKKRLSLHKKASEKVFFLGLVEEAYKYASFFDIGILCSDSEGFPNVIIEYMALGVPCISTDVGDIRYILDHGNAGILVDKYDTKNFVKAIDLLLHHPDKQEQLVEFAKKRFADEFTIDIMKAKYLEIYKEFLDVSIESK